MLAELKERLAIPLATVTVLSFLFGLPFGGVMVGFSVLFFAYIALYIPFVPFLWWKLGDDRSWGWLVFLIGTFGLAVAVVVDSIPEVEHDDFTQLTPSSFGGMGMVLFLVVFLGVILHFTYKQNHKGCPECMNTVLAGARVCQHCGYRWQPPLPAAT